MKKIEAKRLSWVVGASLFSLVLAGSQAKAEIVFENEQTQNPSHESDRDTRSNPSTVHRLDDRASLREAVGVSERAQNTIDSQSVVQPALNSGSSSVRVSAPIAAAPAVVQQPSQVVSYPAAPLATVSSPSSVVVAPPANSGASLSGGTSVVVQQSQSSDSSASSSDSVEVQNTTKTELMRRERMRTELKNEDVLQERLEELRLRDEQRRTSQLLGATASDNGSAAAITVTQPPVQVVPVNATGATGGLRDQVVAVPATEHPGQGAAQSAISAGQSYSGGGMMDQTSVASSAVLSPSTERTLLYVQPRFGLGHMVGDTGYDIRPRFAGGIALGAASSDNISFEFGYSYAEYGIALSTYNPYFMMLGGAGQSPETIAMKQNVIDAGIKLSLLGVDSKIRPFIGAGAGYGFSYVNYDQRILGQLNQNPALANLYGQDYDLKSYLGTLSAGVDVRVNRTVSLGLTGKYYNVFSSRESSALNNAAIYGGYPYYRPIADADKQYIGGSLARVNFYSVLATATFTF